MKTRSQNPAAGHSWVSNLFWLFVAAAMLFISYRLVIPRYHEYYLSKKIEDAARFGAQSHQKPEALQQEIFNIAQEEKIPLKMDDIDIKPGQTVIIHVTYSEPVNLLVAKWVYKVDIEKKSTDW
jgi:cell division protein FtsL